MTGMTPFLMFQRGEAKAAIDFYVAHIPGSRIESCELFDSSGPGPEGTVLRARVTIAGQPVMVHDSFVAHAFDFTPSLSFFIEAADRREFDRLFETLSDGGGVLMPPGDYGWSRLFGWVSDRFGVSWQVNLA